MPLVKFVLYIYPVDSCHCSIIILFIIEYHLKVTCQIFFLCNDHLSFKSNNYKIESLDYIVWHVKLLLSHVLIATVRRVMHSNKPF